MRIRAARTLVFARESGEIVAFNFLAGATCCCSPELLAFLALLDEWTEAADVASRVPTMTPEEIESTIESLLGAGAVTAEGSPLAKAEDDFRQSWTWGIPAALFHFSVQDKDYISVEQTEQLQRSKAAEYGRPDLYTLNTCDTVQLPPALDNNALLQLMARRRTVRAAVAGGITLKQLSDCLFAGLGITGETHNSIGSLPLSMTPSGGARNPYEAYVYARAVEGLAPGFYHYSAFDHTLGRVDTDQMPKPSELVGGQEWADEMPCVIVLCALLERTMWKYEDANAYRVVLIEAGHIGQNLMLAATQHGLSACPTAALSHTRISECIGAKGKFTHAPIYALTLAKPGVDDTTKLRPSVSAASYRAARVAELSPAQ